MTLTVKNQFTMTKNTYLDPTADNVDPSLVLLMTTILHSSNSRTTNKRKLEENLEKVNNFLNDNMLIINREKTTINEIMTKQKRTRITGQTPKLTVKEKRERTKQSTLTDIQDY